MYTDPEKYRLDSRTVWCRITKEFKEIKNMTASVHMLLSHGHLFLDWSQKDVGVCLGELTESSIEAGNKDNKLNKNLFSRRNGLKNQNHDIMTRRLWTADPLILYQEERKTIVRKTTNNVNLESEE